MDTITQIRLLETMLRVRKAELQLAIMYKNGKVPCAAHLYEGQEAIAAGICDHLRHDDCITSTHRGHGHCIAKGMPIKKMIAEVSAKKTGCCGGKGGTMHLFMPEVGVMGTVGIVGGGIPIATGIGLAMKMQNTDRVAVSFFGDGAANNGSFHESLNLAALWKLPVIYICENNLYATSVAVWRSTPIPDIGIRGSAYGMPGVTVDGNHVDEVYAAMETAVARGRAGEGPTLIECKTYRIRGHFEGDDAFYRTKEEVAEARKRDPIDYWKAHLIANGAITEETFEAMSAKADEEVAEAAAFADASPYPEPESALLLSGNPA
ncbi:MAG TPA: thiamine pyrophosphate-dependent dehydrogenase E1 component subunit alpha [Candidatus Hydrogenedentes bacterium]|nr:thiamine pyrophosphate-dependent dehydrogenase E1 component subunit alpha [Candidatus Hydrogenedentota bacterium]